MRNTFVFYRASKIKEHEFSIFKNLCDPIIDLSFDRSWTSAKRYGRKYGKGCSQNLSICATLFEQGGTAYL